LRIRRGWKKGLGWVGQVGWTDAGVAAPREAGRMALPVDRTARVSEGWAGAVRKPGPGTQGSWSQRSF